MGHLVQPLCRSRVIYSRLHRTPSRRVLNISREGDSTTSLGSLFQCSVTLRGKKFTGTEPGAWRLLHVTPGCRLARVRSRSRGKARKPCGVIPAKPCGMAAAESVLASRERSRAAATGRQRAEKALNGCGSAAGCELTSAESCDIPGPSKSSESERNRSFPVVPVASGRRHRPPHPISAPHGRGDPDTRGFPESVSSTAKRRNPPSWSTTPSPSRGRDSERRGMGRVSGHHPAALLWFPWQLI